MCGRLISCRGEQLNKFPSSTVQSFLGTAIPEQAVGVVGCCCPNSVKGQLQSESWETPGDGLVIVTTVVGCDVINARNPHMQSLLRVFILTIS